MNTENTKAQLWFNCVSFPENCPADCEKLISTPDGFSTGDSPTTFECTAMNVMECPLYLQAHVQANLILYDLDGNEVEGDVTVELNNYSTSDYLEGKTRT